MNTDELIEALSQDVKPVRRHALGLRLALGVVGGAAVSLVLIAVMLGFRDLHLAVRSVVFWMKWGYTISLGVGALITVSQLARPEPMKLARFWPVGIPFVLLSALSFAQMARVPPADWLAMWLGHSWKVCPGLILLLSLPIFVGLLWSFRRLAPTQLRTASAAAGLASGAWAAVVYCLHCPEVSALFVLTWYTLGIALSAMLGAVIGPRLLRW